MVATGTIQLYRYQRYLLQQMNSYCHSIRTKLQIKLEDWEFENLIQGRSLFCGRKWLQTLYGSNIEIVGNGINLDRLSYNLMDVLSPARCNWRRNPPATSGPAISSNYCYLLLCSPHMFSVLHLPSTKFVW